MCLVFMTKQISRINSLVKFTSFKSLLSPCAWLVKWHNCELVNNSISDITEKFSLFCNFSASHSIATPAVNFGFYSILFQQPLWYWIELLDMILLIYWLNCWICKELNKMIIMNKSACSAVICQPGGHKQNHNINKNSIGCFVWCDVLAFHVALLFS